MHTEMGFRAEMMRLNGKCVGMRKAVNRLVSRLVSSCGDYVTFMKWLLINHVVHGRIGKDIFYLSRQNAGNIIIFLV
jgi:hypothetical protein